MPQAAQALQVTVPHLPRDYGHMVPPARQLILAHGSAVRQLDIQWEIVFHVDLHGLHGPLFDSTHDEIATQTALVRLQYFLRPFDVTINFRVSGIGRLLATGTIIPTDRLSTFADFNFQYHGMMVYMSVLQADLAWNIRNFGWNPTLAFTRTSPQWRAVVEAHPLHFYVPLGWREGSTLFTRPGTSSSAAPPRNFSIRRDTPRPFDDSGDAEENL